MRMADWTGILVVIGVALIVFLLKYLVIRCYLATCRRDERRNLTNVNQRDSIVLGPPTILIAAHHPMYINPWSLSYPDYLEATQQRRQNRLGIMRGRKPPPKFENALKCSTPVSFIQVTDDSPPPTYEEYLAMTGTCHDEHLSGTNTVNTNSRSTVVIIPEVHQPMNHI